MIQDGQSSKMARVDIFKVTSHLYFYFFCQLIHPDKYGSMKVEDIKSPHGKKGDGGYKYLSEWPPEEQIEMIKSYYKFMFVRHPLERLLSAYRDKVRGGHRHEHRTCSPTDGFAHID